MADLWQLTSLSIEKWDSKVKTVDNIYNCLQAALLQTVSVFIIITIMFFSIIGLNKFLREREYNSSNPKGKIIKARKANKLSAEFLLAYILPLIAFNFNQLQGTILFIIGHTQKYGHDTQALCLRFFASNSSGDMFPIEV